ncbi:unnamed protein product [Lactuca virosa]|uniref:Uncharacterized protein n=1 Tax=Lactuca virosa TaxID=75947 RepID=A0AAU9L985_9ASTR|nr:unnamed protein product [Lactuca virosa]
MKHMKPPFMKHRKAAELQTGQLPLLWDQIPRLTETETSPFTQFIMWSWSGSRYSGLVCMALSSSVYCIMTILSNVFSEWVLPFDALNNTPCLLPSWISQASTRQGRACATRGTPLNSLCLQKKFGSWKYRRVFISCFAASRAISCKYMAILPLDPKLGKMLIMGAFFRCFDPILTIVAGISVKDLFLLPQEKKDVSNPATFTQGHFGLFLISFDGKKLKEKDLLMNIAGGISFLLKHFKLYIL